MILKTTDNFQLSNVDIEQNLSRIKMDAIWDPDM